MPVYLLCFERKLKHAKHYIGFTHSMTSLEQRLKHHRSGNGSKLMAAVAKAQIEFRVSRTWPTGDRTFERKLKNQKNAALLCPHCKVAKVIERTARADIKLMPLTMSPEIERTEKEINRAIEQSVPIPVLTCPVIETAKDYPRLDTMKDSVETPPGAKIVAACAELSRRLELGSWPRPVDKAVELANPVMCVTTTPLEPINLEVSNAQPKSPAHLSRWQRIWNSLASFLRLREIYRLFKR